MPIADFVRHVGDVANNSEASQAVVRSFADAASLRAYADAHAIELSEAEALSLIKAVNSPAPTGVHALSDTDLDAVSGAGMPEGLSRIFDMISSSISPKTVVPPRIS